MGLGIQLCPQLHFSVQPETLSQEPGEGLGRWPPSQFSPQFCKDCKDVTGSQLSYDSYSVLVTLAGVTNPTASGHFWSPAGPPVIPP